MEKTRDPFKKTGDTKQTFHATKDRNSKDLKEAEKKRRQEYTEELYKKKVLMTWINTRVRSLT